MVSFDQAKRAALDAAQRKFVAAVDPARMEGLDHLAVLGFDRGDDGSASAPITLGSRRIVYRYAYMGEIVAFALQVLRDKSPVGSGSDPHPGLYRDSHRIFLNGHAVDDVSSWKPGDQINISTPVPYARKIEIGAMKLSLPGHVYEDATQIVAARYGNQASIKFTFMPVRFGDIAAYAAFSRQERGGRRGDRSTPRRQDWLTRQPAMEITSR